MNLANPYTNLARWGLPVLAVLLLGELSSLWQDSSDPLWTNWLDSVWTIAIPLWAAFLIWRFSRLIEDYSRRTWSFLALFCGLYGITAYLSQNLGLNNAENLLSPSNITYLLGSVCLVVAVVQLWPGLKGWWGFRLALEVLIVTMGEILILWCVYQGKLFEQFQQSAPVQLSVLFFFQFFCLLMQNMTVLAPLESRPFPRWMAGGLSFLSITSIGYLSLLVQGSLTPPLWLTFVGSLGFVFLVIAAASTQWPIPHIHQHILRSIWYLPQVFFVLTLAAFLVTAGLEVLEDHSIHVAMYLFAFIASLVFLRQLLVELENRKLNLDLSEMNSNLERRISERTHELEQSRNYLLAAERLASLGQLTAGLAHEVNTPLAAAMTSFKQADTLAQEYRDSIGLSQVSEADHREIADELGQKLQLGINSLDRLGEIVRKMRSQTRQQSEGRVRVNLAGVVRDTLDLLQHPAMKAKVKLSLEAPAEVFLVCEPGRLSQIITNLVTNAIHACEEAHQRQQGIGRQVLVRLAEHSHEICIEVQDDGLGIPEAMRERIFEPLFTTKEAGRGTGLGLPIVRDIVTSNFAGTLEFSSQVGQGTTFRVILPKKLEAVLV